MQLLQLQLHLSRVYVVFLSLLGLVCGDLVFPAAARLVGSPAFLALFAPAAVSPRRRRDAPERMMLLMIITMILLLLLLLLLIIIIIIIIIII